MVAQRSLALQGGAFSREEAAHFVAKRGASDAVRLGTLMRRDPRVQLGFLAVSGWDTHANQGGVSGQLVGLLSPFAQGISALARSLGPAYAETTIAAARSRKTAMPAPIMATAM